MGKIAIFLGLMGLVLIAGCAEKKISEGGRPPERKFPSDLKNSPHCEHRAANGECVTAEAAR
jgi:hypothetical protein